MKSPINKPIGKLAPNFVAGFDSTTAFIGGLSSFLKGETFSGVGATPTNEVYAKFINSLSNSWKEAVYLWGGIFDAASHKKVDQLDATQLDKWIYNIYPKKKYPVIAIGSSNGALVHLCAALGIPWLPQTFLVPIYKGENLPKDEPLKTIEWSKKYAETFLNNNKGWQLHQMMDPIQDRLRVGNIAYFRIKKLFLEKWYEKFIHECLEPGGTLLVIDCGLSWPTLTIDERHFFQLGGLGAITPDEIYFGSERVKQFFKEQKVDLKEWEIPEPDSKNPEAEWGLQKSLLEDTINFAKKSHFKVSKISFYHPQDLSPLIADLYRCWYSKNNIPADRLLIESFTVHTPLLTIQTGSVPYWLFFNVRTALEMMEDYLEKSPDYKEIYLMILSHGKDDSSVVTIKEWEKAISVVKEKYDFIGVDKQAYPRDFAMYARYNKALQKKLKERYFIDQNLELKDFENFYYENKDKYKVEYEKDINLD